MMKNTPYPRKNPRVSTLAVPALLGLLSIQNSQAAITYTFDDSAPGIITATVAGSIDLAEYTIGTNDVPIVTATISFNFISLSSSVPGTLDYYRGGDVVDRPLDLNTAPLTGPTISFGFSGNTLIVPGDFPLNGIYTIPPDSVYTWAAEDLSDIGLGNLTTTPVTIFDNPSSSGTDGAIQFVVVPEPSSSLLLALTCGALFLLRRR